MTRKILLGVAVLTVLCTAAYLRFLRPHGPREVAYAGNRQVTLWSATAQVREPVTTVNFGDHLDVLGHFQDRVKVRTLNGITGWVGQNDLLSADMWQRARDLDAKTAKMPVQARGHTKTISNLHFEAGRESPRIRQLGKTIPLELLEREAVEVPANSAEEDTEESAEARKEDWWLVRMHASDQPSLSGWMLGRFIDLDVPAPLPDFASSAGMHIIGWFDLNSVKDSSGAQRPQYLVIGVRGSEGQPCDFTLIRVFTWGMQRKRYETAFVKSDVCGKLPMIVTHPSSPGGDALFTFDEMGQGAPEARTYRMHQTIVRRVIESGAHDSSKHSR